MSWAERRVRAGWRWLQTSNRYWFSVPADAVRSLPHLRQFARPALPDSATGEGRVKKKALEQMRLETAALPYLLALRRAAMAADLAKKPWTKQVLSRSAGGI